MSRKEIYYEYLKSDNWDKLRKTKLWIVPYCECCGKYKCVLHCHHHTYPKDLNRCPVSYLQVLCKDCHYGLHNYKRRPRKKHLKMFMKTKGLKTPIISVEQINIYRKYRNLKKIEIVRLPKLKPKPVLINIRDFNLNPKIWGNVADFKRLYVLYLEMPKKRKRFFKEKISISKWASMASMHKALKKRQKNKKTCKIN